jgi:uncharacterized protein (DUF4415 family)
MAIPPTRRPTSALERAEAAFKSATSSKPTEAPAQKVAVIPSGKEAVTIRLDREVLAHFQDEGPGWQERINEALRKAAGL